MAATIQHRGPDDSGYIIEGPVGLAFRRLAILDLSEHGHQPMVAADAPVRIVFNGEIYNYVELREELRALGHVFRSSGDTEVLLRAYLQWGRDCVARLNGMWAFVIDDARSGVLFGSRDRFGIKPLFRANAPGAIVFASEIKAILASGLIAPRAHEPTVAEFLVDGRLDQSEQTFYEGIVQVPAAHSFELDRSGRYKEWRYWEIQPLDGPSADPAEAFADLFEDTVRLHMRSDVPVAVHLSGGLDSTAIACAAHRVRSAAGAHDPITAFCYQDAHYDEARYIDATLAQTNATKIGLTSTPQSLWRSLPAVLEAQDEPFHSMVAVVSYELMRLTARHRIKVVLNGQGADETLAGYGSYFSNAWHSHLVSGHWLRLWRDLRQRSDLLKETPFRLLLDVVARSIRGALQDMPLYRGASDSRWQRESTRQAWLSPEVLSLARPPRYPEQDLNATLAWSVARSPLPLYLRIEDRNSSAHSIEGRVPFLDYRLVNFAFSLPVDWRIRGNLNKFVLREGMLGRIPEVVRTRVDKMGFPVGLAQWMRGELYEEIRAVLTDPAFARTDVVRPIRLIEMLEEHKLGRADHSASVFRAVQIYHWCRRLSRTPVAAVSSQH